MYFVSGEAETSSNLPVTAKTIVPESERSSIRSSGLELLPVKIMFTLPGKGSDGVPADSFPPLTQILVAVMLIYSNEGSNLRVPSIYSVPKVNDAILKSMVHSQGMITSSPD